MDALALLQVGSIQYTAWLICIFFLKLTKSINQPTTLVLFNVFKSLKRPQFWENRFRWTTADVRWWWTSLRLFRFFLLVDIGNFWEVASPRRISDNLNVIVTSHGLVKANKRYMKQKTSHVCLFQVTQGAPIALKWYEWTSNAICFLNVSHSKQLELAGKLMSFRFSEIMGV